MNGVGCFAGFGDGFTNITILSGSLIISAVLLLLLRKKGLSTKGKVSLIYGHLTFLFFPFAFFSINMGCGFACMSCYNNLFHLALYALPTTLISSTLVGFVVIPSMYIFTNKKMPIKNKWVNDFVGKYSKSLNIRIPRIYAIDNAKPVAFSFRSFRSAIFMSVGVFEILNRQEIKAVLLHELAHIRQKSSVLKLSNVIMKFFSPLSVLAGFNLDSGAEEEKADNYAVEVQGTSMYLLSAKNKINFYNNTSEKAEN